MKAAAEMAPSLRWFHYGITSNEWWIGEALMVKQASALIDDAHCSLRNS